MGDNEKAEIIRLEVKSARIHIVNHYRYSYKFGSIDSTTKTLSSSDEYDSEGRVKIIKSFNNFSKNDSASIPRIDSTIFFYDSNNCVAKSLRFEYFNLNDTIFRREKKRINKFDKQRNIIEQKDFLDNVLQHVNVYKYNNKDFLSEVIKYSPDNEVLIRDQYNYKEGKHVGITTLNKNQKIIRKILINEVEDNTFEHTQYGENNVAASIKEVYKYDKRGNLVEWLTDYSDSKSKYTYTFNDWGFKISSTNFVDEEPTSFFKADVIKY